MNKQKRALINSIISLVLCFSMLLGTTWAWFTDSASTAVNTIQSGTLKVGLVDENDVDLEGAPLTFYNKDGEDDILWEPGVTFLTQGFKVVNKGNLALQYKLAITGINGDAELLKVIDFWLTTDPANPETGKVDLSTYEGHLVKEQASNLYYLVGHMKEEAGNDYQTKKLELDSVGITVYASQDNVESDSFGNTYDENAEYPEGADFVGGSASTAVSVENGAVKTGVTMTNSDGSVSADVPAGVQVKDGVEELTLSVTKMTATTSNVVAEDDQILIPVDVHIDGVAEGNTKPMTIAVKGLMQPGLNNGNYSLVHVENGVSVPMTRVESKADLAAHNQYAYDPADGTVYLHLATFSEVAVVADTESKWEGNFDYSWYTNAVALLDTEATADYIIANADQLAAFGAIVGGMDGQTQNSFAGKTVKLIADVNLGDKESENNPDIIFYPIGYNSDDGKYEKTGVAVSTGFYTFEGTFDGNGHTISNFYQNTWEMKGDHNWYDAALQYYRDGMGLFGKVYGGTVKNLTVDNFSSDGEIATTGVIAAYADGATFENIAITNCNPRVYNIGNGGIVGCVGWYAKEAGLKTTFTNITVDNSNKISALWGSYDVACGGIVGQYYPTSGQTSAGTPKNAGIDMVNCHVAAQMDVYNDVCGNYQYYAYRYAGMMIGSIRENTTDKETGKTIPDMTGISATGCTVHYDSWNDYYYCELVANSKASYTHDHQFSRLTQVDSVDVGNKTVTVDGETTAVPTSGSYNYVVVNGKHDTENATCYHFVDGEPWTHDKAGKETVNGVEMDVEDHAHIYLPFAQLFTGYGWGVTSKGLEAFNGVGVTHRDSTDLIEKFEKNDALSGDFLYRVGNGNAFPVGKLFQAIDENLVVDSGVHVSVKSLIEGVNMVGTFVNNKDDWTQSTLHITGGTGPVKLTIQDYNNCEPFTLVVEVVDATNLTSATAGTGKNFVLLQDVTYSGTYLYYKNSTLYGNGFTIDIAGADHSDLNDASDTNSNKSAYCNIWMVDSRFDNVQITGSVYPDVGMTADSDYGNAAIRTEGECYITNSYISNTRVPLRVQGNTTLIDTVVDGGRYANIELRSGKLTLDGVTTINTVRKGSDGTTDVIGFGIVIHSEASNASIAVGDGGLKQYNWAGENKHKAILSGDTYLSNAYKLIFNANNSDTIFFDYNEDRYVNTGILCLCADINTDVVTGLDDRYVQEVNGYDAWVLTYDNRKHTDWFNESVAIETVSAKLKQYPVIPDYSGNAAQTVEFTKGETHYFDTSVLKAEKFGQTLTVSSVVLNDTPYNYGDKIPLTEGGVFEVVYTVADPYNYNADASAAEAVNHTVSITVTAIAKDAEILAPKFTFIDQNGNKYEATTVKAGDKTYVMPDVTAADPTTNSMSSINIGSASISGTTVYFPVATGYTVRSDSNFNRYYPLFNGINITDYTIAGDTTGTTYTTSGNYTSSVGSSGTKFIIPANGGQTNCGDYVKTDGQAGNAAGNSDSGWQGAGYSTSYGGTYLKSGNTNASSGADSNGYERIVWVEYSFNAGNGDVYYYRIGYHCNKEDPQCVTEGTLFTLADGTQKAVEDLVVGDMLLVFNHVTGKTEAAPVIFNNHADQERAWRDVLHLNFSNGEEVEVVSAHGFFDISLMEYVYITDENYTNYIGHNFYALGDGSGEIVTLTEAYVEQEYTRIFCPVTYFHMNSFANSLLNTPNIPGDITGLVNYFEYDSDLKYNEEKMQADIEKYGLYTYEDFADYISYEAYLSSPSVYLKVAVGKGMITFEEILAVIEYLLAGSLIQ